jgi:nucleotide-binding universal stress UspA family protein
VAVEAIQVSDTPERYEEDVKLLAARNLSTLKATAEDAGVPLQLVHTSSDFPYEEIVKTAQEKGCDVIFLASHGRRGVRAVIMGSETTKVLTHTKIPVVVYR